MSYILEPGSESEISVSADSEDEDYLREVADSLEEGVELHVESSVLRRSRAPMAKSHFLTPKNIDFLLKNATFDRLNFLVHFLQENKVKICKSMIFFSKIILLCKKFMFLES